MGNGKIRRLLFASGISLAALGLASGCAASHPDTVVLKFADSYSATHPIGKSGAQPFLEYLQEHGPDVGLEIEYYGNGQMGASKDVPTLLRTDVIQIGVVTPSNSSSQLPMSSVSELPGLVDNACIGSKALISLMQEGGSLYESELEPMGIRPLWAAFVTNYEIMTSESKVTTPEDVRGLLIRSNGGIADRAVDHLGASGVSLPGPDLYEALTRGTVSGALFPPVSVMSYRLDETLKYSTYGANLGLSNSTYAISTKAWSELNEQQRQVVSEAATLAQNKSCKELPEAAEDAFTEMQDNGVELVPVSDNLAADWKAALEPVQEEWVRDLESIGHPASEVLEDFKQALKEGKQ